MVCRHASGDPNCSSTRTWAPTPRPAPEVPTPDKRNYEIEQLERVGPHLVLRVRYPNCRACAYEGNKVMVFLDVPEAQALKWREIDPHFRDPARPVDKKEAPSPAARFPGSVDGWDDAIEYARMKWNSRGRVE